MMDPQQQLMDRLGEAVSKVIARLLSEQHLYQSERVDMSEIDRARQAARKRHTVSTPEVEALDGLIHMPWEPRHIGNLMAALSSGLGRVYRVVFDLPHVKLYCPTCDRLEAHNPYENVISGSVPTLTHFTGEGAKNTRQLFVPTYECQSCKKQLVTFMLSRDGAKVTLTGRHPIEAVQVPSIIPKNQRAHFSDAIVAANSGQVLPGLFMLRTFVEQYAYEQQPAQKAYADKAIAAYMDSLPADFKNRFPSLRSAYERLSEAIHGASADAALFETVRGEIIEHFEAKRLYKIA